MNIKQCIPVTNTINKIIKERGFKKNIIAQKAGFTAQQFSDILNGRKILKASDVPSISIALGVDPNTLYQYEDDTPQKKGGEGGDDSKRGEKSNAS